MHKTILASAGGVAAAVLGSLCCMGPLTFAALGVGSGLAASFEPLRPILGILMVAMLGLGFYTVYGKRPPAADGSLNGESTGLACAVIPHRARDKMILWSATVVAIVLWTFPSWNRLFQ